MQSDTKDSLIIRSATPADAELLSALARRSKASWGYSAAFMRACTEELTYTVEDITSGKYYFAVADLAGQCIGFYVLTLLSRAEAELEALFVEPENIGEGYGKALLNHAKAAAAELGASRLIVQSDPFAAEFYRSQGAVLCGSRESASIHGRYLPLYMIRVTRVDPLHGAQAHISGSRHLEAGT